MISYQVENSDQPMQGNLTVFDSQFRSMDTGFWIRCQWNLGSGFQLQVGSRILELYSRFQSPRFQIPREKFPGFRFPLHEATVTLI